jgi:hypothetical protein
MVRPLSTNWETSLKDCWFVLFYFLQTPTCSYLPKLFENNSFLAFKNYSRVEVGHLWTRDNNGQGFFHVKHIIEKFQKTIKYVFKDCLIHTKKSDMYKHSFKIYGSICVLVIKVISVRIKVFNF